VKHRSNCSIVPISLLLCAALAQRATAADDPLPSWNDCAAKRAVIDFVGRVTKEGGPDYVPPAERIATFDNDGTLWCEKPMYFQALFALDRVKALSDKHPEWKTTEPFKSVLDGNDKELAALGQRALIDVVETTHSGMSVSEFETLVRDWMHTARHPRFKRPYDTCIYQPMVEVLQYLRANDFKTFIVSGGGIDFMRPWVDKAYGIPPEQVVGTSGVVKFEIVDGKPLLLKEPKIDFIDDGPGKPVGIYRFIGRHPIIAFGNSDGDLEMLQFTTMTGEPQRPRLGLIVHHTDAEREYAYDRDSDVGRLNKAWDQAAERGWLLIDMKNDWKKIFPDFN
jgi:phosphoglycolate phosphatase-like HAD superfamily hydrolase